MWQTFNTYFGSYEAWDFAVFDYKIPKGELIPTFHRTYENLKMRESFPGVGRLNSVGLFSICGMVYVMMSDVTGLVDTLQVFLYAEESLNLQQNVTVKEFVANEKNIGAPDFQAIPIIFAD